MFVYRSGEFEMGKTNVLYDYQKTGKVCVMQRLIKASCAIAAEEIVKQKADRIA